MPGRLLKVLEAGVGPEGLGDCSAAHFADPVVLQAAGKKIALDESSTFELSSALLDK